MPDKLTISHRGARYEIGRGKRYYGIWVAGAPQSDPIDRWPETPEGWAQAWARFTALETPGTITAAERSRAGFRLPGIRPRRERAAADAGGGKSTGNAIGATALLSLGVILGIAGLFPAYFTGQSLASQADQLVPHLLYLAGWALSAVLIWRGTGAARGAAGVTGAARGGLARAGALFGLGLSAVTLGLFLSDLGEVISGQSHLQAGMVLGLAGWAACTAGSAAGLTIRSTATPAGASAQGSYGRPVRPHAGQAGPIALLVLAAGFTAWFFWPSWDSYTLQSSAGTQTITAGNAFANPGAVITGDVIVMIAVVAVALLAALWQPARQGAALLAGAIVPMAAQAISALIQVSQPTPPGQFGISQAQAQAAGLTISSGVTSIFWVYCVFVISLVISCAWMLTTPAHPAAPQSPWPGPIPPVRGFAAESSDSGDNGSDSEAKTAGDSEGNAAGDSGTGKEGGGDAGDEESSFA